MNNKEYVRLCDLVVGEIYRSRVSGKTIVEVVITRNSPPVSKNATPYVMGQYYNAKTGILVDYVVQDYTLMSKP
jgi:hypothetical protein